MKKVLSVVLALCLTLLMCVPAFAADITLTQDTADSATVTVQTSDWEDAARFTVTIPATVTIPWGGTSAENGGDTFTWSYESQLLNGQHLEMWLDKSAGAFNGAGLRLLAGLHAGWLCPGGNRKILHRGSGGEREPDDFHFDCRFPMGGGSLCGVFRYADLYRGGL